MIRFMSQSSPADQPQRIGIIGGTGVEEALGAEGGKTVEPETPFGPPSAPITLTQWQGVELAILRRHGIGHRFNPTHVPYRANIFALKTLGVSHIIATGATGSLDEDVHPGDLVIVDQVIDKTFRRESTYYNNVAAHIELADPFCPVMRKWLLDAATRVTDEVGEPVSVHDGGTYVCMEGPAFSTRAESHLHRGWGAQLIGMTAMPEAKLAREAEMAYALIALPTDYDCWKPHETYGDHGDLLSQIIANLKRATKTSLSLVREALKDTEPLRARPSPAHDALKLAIWTDRKQIPADEIERLRPLWGRYFE